FRNKEHNALFRVEADKQNGQRVQTDAKPGPRKRQGLCSVPSIPAREISEGHRIGLFRAAPSSTLESRGGRQILNCRRFACQRLEVDGFSPGPGIVFLNVALPLLAQTVFSLIVDTL